MLAQRDEALKSQDRQMRVKDIQVATLLGRFGFDSAESAEALCTELGQGKGKVVDIREVLSELEETKQEKDRHETLRMDAHRAMAETIEDVRKERRKGEELKALNERLREEADAAREEKERWMGEVRRLEEVQEHLQNKIHELELKARTSALVTNPDKENRYGS
jgi:chromosome segregation ATPase